VVVPLLCKPGFAGHALPPEGVLETWKSISAKVSTGHIMSTDGSQAFHTVFRLRGTTHSSNAIHSKDIFTPVTSLSKSGLSEQDTKTLRSLAVRKKPAAREMAHEFRIVGGDNQAESAIAMIKNQLRRTCTLHGHPDKVPHRPALSAKYVHEKHWRLQSSGVDNVSASHQGLSKWTGHRPRQPALFLKSLWQRRRTLLKNKLE
jgi:hypothetical protein